MKAFKVLHSKVIILVLAFILLGTSISSFALINENCSVEPKGLTINTEDRIIGEFYYDNFKIDVQKIVSAAGIGYCLDLDKDYPVGQRFSSYGIATDDINIILSNGYPNRGVEELGVNDEDEAYLATQVALWTLFEGYNINRIDTGSVDVNAAAKIIYNNVMNNRGYNLENDTILYKTGNYNIQGVVIYVRQPIDIKPIPPVEVVPPVEEGTGGVTSPPSNQKPTEDNKEQGTGGVNDNIQDNLPVGKGR